MDVLHFLKSHHDSVRRGLISLSDADGVKARRAAFDELARDVQVHLSLEKDYLYPEISGLFSGAEALVTAGLASGVVIGRRLKVIAKLVAKTSAEQGEFPKRLAELREAVLKHLEQEEQSLMPKMRSMIRTEEREDLGQVFMDVKADVLAATTVLENKGAIEKALASSSTSKGRKRA